MDGSISRRSFLRSAALLTAVVGCYPWRSASAALDSADPKFDGGKFWVAELGGAADFGSDPVFLVAKYKNGKGELMDEEKIYVRAAGSGDKKSYVVLSAICTHLKCKIDYSADAGKFKCPCHKSEFSLDGEVLKKPAKRDLPNYSDRLVVEAGKLYLRHKAE
ncbi:ubiquinol-cytochrome c reductase iron-sulfur subunit [bacterium]|nr:ubiquinol-cytochrome c reductase iron-sulfur subunit [bacterium]